MRAIERLEEATRPLHAELAEEGAALLRAQSAADYQRYLARAYGFVAPLERCLLDTADLATFVDPRRLRKHLLLEHDLQALGLRPLEIQSVPQCMWIPWFEDPYTALGWAFILERSVLEHPSLFRHLATVLPGEAAFAASYLKAYTGTSGAMWKNFADGVERAIASPEHFETVLEGARAGYRHFRRWRNTLDGKALSGPHTPTGEQPPLTHASATTPTTEPVADTAEES